jgi:SAM-dependent methyltransferase
MTDSGSGLNQSGIVRTSNGYGWSSTVPNQVTCAAAQHIREIGGSPLVLDVGAGLGVGTLPFLQAGANVIALDLEETHLAAIRAEARRHGYGDRLETICGELPFVEFDGVDVVHC